MVFFPLFLSTIVALLSVFLPVIILKSMKDINKLVCYYISPLFQLILVVIAYSIFPSFYNKHDHYTYFMFYSTIVSVTVVIISIIITGAMKGIRKLSNQTTQNKSIEIFRLIMYLLYFLTFPHLLFGLIYSFWGIAVLANNITIYESLYFSFSVIYSLPESKVLDEFKNYISDSHVIQFLYILHIIITKAFEIIVLAFVASKLFNFMNFSRVEN